jgi:hypothetical protein
MEQTPDIIKVKLSGKGHNFSTLALEIAKETGIRVSGDNVSKAVHRWAGKATGAPRGKTLLILKRASDVIGEPVAPAISCLIQKEL